MDHSEVSELRKQKAYIERRLNVTCALSPAQLEKAVDFVMGSRKLSREEAEQELIRQRFCWEAMAAEALKDALEWKKRLLDAIEEAEPVRNPCIECYQKTPEARAAKRKADGVAKPAAEAGEKKPKSDKKAKTS